MKVSNKYWVLRCDGMYYNASEELHWFYDLNSATQFEEKEVAESRAEYLVKNLAKAVECVEVSSVLHLSRKSRVRQSRTYGIIDDEDNFIYDEGDQCSYKDSREAEEKLKELKNKGVTNIKIVTLTTTFQEEFYE